MVSSLVAGQYNVVIVQVLGYMDRTASAAHGAHWKSNILPWSTRVTSSFDPLAYLCTQAHANGIEVHAWLGGSGGAMYRVSTAWPPANNATLTAHPEWFMVPRANSEGGQVVAINGNYLLDMGSSDAQEYLVSIVRELVTNYEIDGINWDDEHGTAEYNAGLGFPAYSQANYARSGLARYRINTGATGTPAYDDASYSNYRRRFKNELIARCQAEIQSIKTNPRQPLRHTAATVVYGDAPSTCAFTGTEAYRYSFSDWAGMLQNGWLDAAIPMNYKTEPTYHSYFINWCNRAYSCWRYNRHIYMGLGAYLNSKAETLDQLEYAYTGQSGGTGFNGAVTYSYGVPTTDSSPADWWAYAAANIYTTAATVPTMPWRKPATATEGIMWGRVTDPQSGAYVDDATVTVTDGPTVQTDGNGYYVATLVPATAGGTVHSTTASKGGTTSHTIADATVLAGDIVRYDFTLKAVTTTVLSSITPDPACTGTAVGLTATVAGAYGPTGQVEFLDGATSLGTATLVSGSATKSVSSLAVGTHNSITAAYLGDTQNNPSTSSPGSVTINPEPTALSVNRDRFQGASLKIKISDLTPDTIASLGTAAHGTVSEDDTYIFYAPLPNDNNNDSFTYTAANANCTKQATINVTVIPAGGAAQEAILVDGKPTIRFAGIPGYSYRVERAEDVGFTVNLTTVLTTNAPTSGLFIFVDNDPPVSQGFYRLRYDP